MYDEIRAQSRVIETRGLDRNGHLMSGNEAEAAGRAGTVSPSAHCGGSSVPPPQ